MTLSIGQRLEAGSGLLALSDDSYSSEDLISLEQADEDYAQMQGMHEESSPDSSAEFFYHGLNSESLLGFILTDSKDLPGRKGGLTYIGKSFGFQPVYKSPPKTNGQAAQPSYIERVADDIAFTEPIISQNRRRGRNSLFLPQIFRKLKKEETAYGIRAAKLSHPKNKFYHNPKIERVEDESLESELIFS